jgi:hypothetical protein
MVWTAAISVSCSFGAAIELWSKIHRGRVTYRRLEETAQATSLQLAGRLLVRIRVPSFIQRLLTALFVFVGTHLQWRSCRHNITTRSVVISSKL